MAQPKIEGFTKHQRGGWVRRHAGHTIWCGNATATRDELERTFAAKADAIDAKLASGGPPVIYRELLSEFMDAMQARVRTGKPRPLAERTLHNYRVTLNHFGKFVGGGSDLNRVNRPEVFGKYADRFGGWKSSGYDSIITRVSALFRWAERMEYIDRFRPGPQFVRPAKSDLRAERIDLSKTFTAAEFAKLYQAANPVMRCWLGLGLFCALNNSEVAHLSAGMIDFDKQIIDFRRRKEGRRKRLCPMPDQLIADLRVYRRPEPAHEADDALLFITRGGHPFGGTRRRDGKPSDMISRLFRELMKDAGVECRRGRNFSGLRTTWYNITAGQPDLERRIIFGRAQGTTDFDSYLELGSVAHSRLRSVTAHVYRWLSSPPSDSALAWPAVPFAADVSSSPAPPADSGSPAVPPSIPINAP